MATKRVWYPDGLLLPGESIVQLSSCTPAYNYTDFSEKTAGEFGPGFVGANQASPGITFTSRQIDTLLKMFDPAQGGVQDLCLDMRKNPPTGGGADFTCRFVLRSGQPFGIREPDDDSNHRAVDLIESGFMCWESITASQGSAAEINCAIKIAADPVELEKGVAAGKEPFVWAGPDPDLTANPLRVVDSLYTLGPVSFSSSVKRMFGVQSVTWENNVEYEEQFSEGEEFPTLQGIRTIAPEVRINTTDMQLVEDITSGTDARGILGSPLTVYLRRMSQTKITDDDASTVHISLKLNRCLVNVRTIQDNPATTELTFRGFIAPGEQMFDVDRDIAIPVNPNP